MRRSIHPRTGLAIVIMLMFMAGMALVTPASGQVEDAPPTVHVTVDADSQYQTVDVSFGQVSLNVRGEVDVERSTLVGRDVIHMSVDGTEWDWTVTPAERTVTAARDTFSFTAVVVVPAGTSEGVYDATVVATWFDKDGVPHEWDDAFKVRVINLPFRVYADPIYLVMDPGQTSKVEVTIEDRSLTGLTYLCQVGKATSPDPGDWLKWVLLWLDSNSLELEPGATETVTLDVVVPLNATGGTMNVPVLVMVEGHPEYTQQLDVTVRVKGVPIEPPGGDEDSSWLPIDPIYLLALSLVVVGIGLVGFLGFTEVGTLALFWGLLLPLFTRLRRNEVLNQFTRGEIFGFIKANPGVHLTAIKENLNLANGVLAYHLKVLVREEFVVVRREGGFKRFYPRDMRVPRKRVHFTRLQLDIVEKLHLHPGLTQAALARMLGESKQVINYNISVLMAADVVRVEREGGKTLCYVKDGAAIKPQMAELVEEDEDETVESSVAIPSQMKL